jgi:two-component system response regulator RegX3
VTVLDTEPQTASVRPRAWPRVLVVDGEASYREALASGLGREGFEVEGAADAHQALQMFGHVRPDLVLLNAVLPDESGIELCERIQSLATTPVIIVTERSSEGDVVLGLDHGACDYVSKPFRVRELVARMRAVLRRVTADPVDEVLVAGPVRLDTVRRDVHVSGQPVELCRKEFELLQLFMSRAGQVMTRETCIDHVWRNRELVDTRTLDTHVKRIRRKIELDPARPRHLVTVRGIGFRFEP